MGNVTQPDGVDELLSLEKTVDPDEASDGITVTFDVTPVRDIALAFRVVDPLPDPVSATDLSFDADDDGWVDQDGGFVVFVGTVASDGRCSASYRVDPPDGVRAASFTHSPIVDAVQPVSNETAVENDPPLWRRSVQAPSKVVQNPSCSSGPDAPEADAPESDAPEAVADESDSSEPDASEPDASEPDASKSRAPESGASKSEALEPDVPDRRAPEAAADESDASEAAVDESDLPESDVDDSDPPAVDADDSDGPGIDPAEPDATGGDGDPLDSEAERVFAALKAEYAPSEYDDISDEMATHFQDEVSFDDLVRRPGETDGATTDGTDPDPVPGSDRDGAGARGDAPETNEASGEPATGTNVGDSAPDDGPSRGDAADGTPPVDGSASVLSALVEELRDGDVSAAEVAELRDALEREAESPRHLEVQLQYVKSQVADLNAYVDALEAFLDDNGTAVELLDRLQTGLADVSDRLDRHEDGLSELRTRTDDVEDRVDEVARTVRSLADELEANPELDDRISELERQLDARERRWNRLREAFSERPTE